MSRLPQRTALVISLIVISVALVGLSRAGTLRGLTSVVSLPFTAMQRSVTQLWGNVAGIFQRNPDLEALQQENAGLQAEIARLQARVTALEENEAIVQTLSGLVNYARTQPQNEYLAANVIGRDPSPFLKYVIFDRGSDDGVFRDMPVVTEAGLVGTVVEVTSQACKVQLIVDPNSAVNALLQNSRERGVVVGQLAGGVVMQYISQQAAIAPGEMVVTSGLGGTLPEGIPIGAVSAVQQLNYEVLQQADVTPGVDFNQLEIALIILNFKPTDLSPFTTTP